MGSASADILHSTTGNALHSFPQSALSSCGACHLELAHSWTSSLRRRKSPLVDAVWVIHDMCTHCLSNWTLQVPNPLLSGLLAKDSISKPFAPGSDTLNLDMNIVWYHFTNFGKHLLWTSCTHAWLTKRKKIVCLK